MKTIVLFLVLLAQTLFAKMPMDEAVTLYQQGRYDEARAMYRSFSEQNLYSADALYNLGNTYYKQGEWGEALTYYSKARRLAPRDRDIAFNMALLRTHLRQQPSMSPFSAEAMGILTQWISVNEAALLFFIPLSGCLFFLSLVVVFRKPWGDFQVRILVTFGVSVVFGLLFLLKCSGDVWPEYVILIDEKTSVKSGPSERLTTQGYVYEGTKMCVKGREGDWVNVVLSNGVEGWVNKDVLWVL